MVLQEQLENLMRIILANARLADRAGSELATMEIADAHMRNGHDVVIFTLVRGDAADEYSRRTGVPVLGPADGEALSAFAPDLIHVHHWPTIVTLEWIGIVAPWVIGFLGSIPPLEIPPPLLPGREVPWWTLNEVAADQFSEIPGWGLSPHIVVGNWFDDHGITDSAVAAPETLRRLLVVSNHFPENVRRELADVTASMGIEVTHVGLPGQQAVVDQTMLRQFDGVITLGRTALLAMATGVPVLVLDHFGSDGWVVPADIENQARHNFSGRWQGLDPTPECLELWLRNPPSADDLRGVQEWAFGNARLSQVHARIESMYGEPCTSPPSEVFGRGSLAVGELLWEFDRRNRNDAHRSAEAHSHAIAQRDEARAERDHAAAQRDALLNSRVWRSTEWYRRLRRRLSA